MTNKTDLLDPSAENDLSDFENEVIEDARNAGKNLKTTDPTNGGKQASSKIDTGGVTAQTFDSKAVAEFGQSGGDSDISGGAANLDETTRAAVEQNGYNR